MGKLQNNQKGFSAVEALLVILILVIIGAVGYMVYRNDHKTKTLGVSTSAKTTLTKPAMASNNKTATTVPTTISTSAVTSLVTIFYNQYSACFNSGDLSQTCTTNLVKQYGTSILYYYYKPSTGSYAADPIMCAQDNPPSFKVSGVTATSTSASGVVTENFSTPNTVKFTVVSQSGNLKIDTITCNPPLAAQLESP